MKTWKRLISILCCITLLPISVFSAAAEDEEPAEAQRWTRETRNATVHLQNDLVIDGAVLFTDGAELIVDSGSFYLTPDAVFTGNLILKGDDIAADIGGTVCGNITVSSPSAYVSVSGRVDGSLSVSNYQSPGRSGQGAQLSILEDASVDTLYLDGKGFVWNQGQVRVLDTSASNEIGVQTDHGTVDTLYARSNVQYIFSNEASVGTVIMDMSYKNAPLPNVGFYNNAHANKAIVHSGWIDFYDGASADEVYMEDHSAIHIDLAYFSSKEVPTEEEAESLWLPHVEKLFARGEDIYCVNRGRIGYASVQGAFFQNAGQIETLVLQSSTLENQYGGRYGNEEEVENHYRDVFELYFDHHVGTLVAMDSAVSANQGSIFQRVFSERSNLSFFDGAADTLIIGGDTWGTIGEHAEIGMLVLAAQHDLNICTENIGWPSAADDPAESRQAAKATAISGGQWETAAVKLENGTYRVQSGLGSAYFTVPCDAYSSLNLSLEALGGYGCALVRTPDGLYTLLEPSAENRSCSLFSETEGDCLIRVLSASDAASCLLKTKTLSPIHLDLTLTEYTARDGADEMIARACDPGEETIELFNITQGRTLTPISISSQAVYCLPEQARPGDKIEIRAFSANPAVSAASATVRLDADLYAAAALDLREKGRYRAVPKDDTRARLYLYDESGAFLQEVYPTAQGYDTGALEAGTYYAVWIRGGIGAWKLLRLENYAENALTAGTHYLLETLHIADGALLRAQPDIPGEPSLQSPYLAAEGTGYEARKSAVVRGDLALFSLQWALTEESEGAEEAQILFLNSAEYLEGSAILNGTAAQGVSWDRHALTVPLSGRSGKLLFYMEAAGEDAAMISNAFVKVKTPEGTKTQYIGSAQVKVSRLSISGPTLTSGREVLMTGCAAPYSQLTLLDQGRRVTSAVAGARGQWSALVPLSSEKTHVITAKTEDGLLTAPVTVTRAAGAPRLKQFVLDYNEHGMNKQVVVSGDSFGKREIRFAYLPGTELVFTLTLENDALLRDVTLVALMDGARFELPAVRAGEGQWVARGQFTADDMFAPDQYAIEYAFREDALLEAFREPYVEVPLMRVLVSADDWTEGLPLSRYYMASPSLQTVDRGFGPGWLTNYDVYAAVTGEGSQRRLSVWSPAETRLFAPDGQGFLEVGGYAKASVREEGVLVEEQDGSKLIFDPDGKLSAVADASGWTVSLSYDGGGRLRAVNAPDASLQWNYDEDGRIASVSCGSETIAYTYEHGTLTRAEGARLHCAYTYDGLFTQAGLHPLTAAAQGDEILRLRYNGQGFPAWMDLDGEQVWLEYGESTVEVMNAEGSAVTYTLNDQGGLSRMDASDGSWTQITALQDGSTQILSFARGQTSSMTLDGYGRIVEQTDPEGRAARFAYDGQGHLSAVTDQAGHVTRYETDAQGQTTAILYPDGTAKRFRYDADGNLTQITNQAGETTYFVYQDGALSRVYWPDETYTDYEYTAEENGLGVAFRRLNQRGSLWADENGFDCSLTDAVSVQWYRGDARAYAMALNGQGTYSALNEDGDLCDVYGWGEDIHLLHWDYADDALVRETLANGVTTTHVWDAERRTHRMENLAPDGALLSFYELAWNELGNVTRVTTPEGVWECAYDAIGQLIRTEGPDGVTEYAYDAAGNRTAKTVNGETTEYTYDAMNRLLTAGGVSYAYDLNGRLISKHGNGESVRYTWNAQDQLTRVAQGDQVTEYAYDLFGNRSSMTVNGQTRAYYTLPTELSQTLAMEDEQGMTVFYVGDAGLICAQRDDRKYYYTYTPLGSVSEITDEEGNVAARYTYDLEGHVTGAEILEEGLFDNPFTYVGRYGVLDDGNGLWCARARFVDQQTLRFISPDPVEQEYDLNLYRYAGNNSVENVDITGEGKLSYVRYFSGNPFVKQKLHVKDGIKLESFIAKKELETATKDLNRTILELEKANDTTKGKNINTLFIKGVMPATVLTTLQNPQVQYEAIQKLKEVGTIILDIAPIALPILVKALAKAGLGTVTAPTGAGTALTVLLWASTAKDLYDLSQEIKNILDDHNQEQQDDHSDNDSDDQNKDNNRKTLATTPAETKIDPSGYVYEAVVSNRVEGVTATVYYQDDEGYPVFWQAQEYDEINPQATDAAGQYGWDVPTGRWRVRFEKAGFETLETSWLPVPPPQTEVNAGLVSRQAPEIVDAVRRGDHLEFLFSRYMLPETVQGAVFVNGAPVEIRPLNAEPAANDPSVLLASRFEASGLPEAEQTVLTVHAGAVSYAGVPAAPIQVTTRRVYAVDSIRLEPAYTVPLDEEAVIQLQVQGEGHFDTLRFSAALSGHGCVDDCTLSPADADGQMTLTLRPIQPGTATLQITEETNGIVFTAEIWVEEPEDGCLYRAVAENPSDTAVSLWNLSGNGEIAARVPNGETVKILVEMDNGWMVAQYRQTEGYVDGRFLRRLDQ